MRVVGPLLIGIIASVAVFTASPSIAQSHISAVSAYDRGDYAIARSKWQQLADQGDPQAMIQIGLMHLRGHGVRRSSIEAAKWFRMGANLGNAEAQFKLGFLLANIGLAPDDSVGHVQKNYAEGLRWYRAAAKQGHNLAAFHTGHAYSYARGVKQNFGEALHWYKRAARLGNSHGAFNVGFMYFHGQGIPQDVPKSLMWFKIATDLGYVFGPSVLEILLPTLNPDQIAEADRLADHWLRRHRTDRRGPSSR